MEATTKAPQMIDALSGNRHRPAQFVRLSSDAGEVELRLHHNGAYTVAVKPRGESTWKQTVSGNTQTLEAAPKTITTAPDALDERLELPGGLVIDPNERTATVKGTALVMAAKEWDLLLYLARDPYRCCTKEELLASVWSWSGARGHTRTLDSHASRLRRKLADLGFYAIENVWGVGYRLLDRSKVAA